MAGQASVDMSFNRMENNEYLLAILCHVTVRHCGLVESARTWDGASRVYRAHDYSGLFGVLWYIWLDTKIVLKKNSGQVNSQHCLTRQLHGFKKRFQKLWNRPSSVDVGNLKE